MKRREFIAATAALLVSPRALRAQGTPRRIACFGIGYAPFILDAWRSGLRERGWIEGKNLLVEYRYTQPTDRYPAAAAGVRKAPMHEVAGSWALAGSECYGDLMLAPISMMSGTPARHHLDVCTREVGRVQ